MYYDGYMKEFQERRVLRKIIYSKFTFILLGIILILLVYSVVKIYLRSRDAVLVNKMVEKEVEELRVKKADLEATIKHLETPSGAEEEIRQRFPVQKPGEKMVVIVEEEKNISPPLEKSSSDFFSKIWQFLKNIF